jgi:hypothetical protein
MTRADFGFSDKIKNVLKRPKILVVKQGETFALDDLASDEAFYSVLENDESVTINFGSGIIVKFTRTDDGAEERYYIKEANDAALSSNIIINTDNLGASSTLAISNNEYTGYLLDDDIITINSVKIVIGSVGGDGQSGSFGDPYVFSMRSNIPVKLPNKSACYRMFEQGNNFVNVEVGRASKNHQERMLKYASDITPVTHNITCDGFFYTKAFISAEGHDVTIDYEKKTLSMGTEGFFKVEKYKKLVNCGGFRDTCRCFSVQWETSDKKAIKTEIMFFPNPHIENGINVIPQTLKKSTGMLVDNYKPKLMKLPSVTTLKYGKLHRRLANTENLFQKKAIKGKNEKWHFKK